METRATDTSGKLFIKSIDMPSRAIRLAGMKENIFDIIVPKTHITTPKMK
jgi:hypothetical protein